MSSDPQYQPTARDDRPRHAVAEWGALTLVATVGAGFTALFQAMMIVGGGGFTASRVLWLGGSLVVLFFGVVLMAGRGVARTARLDRAARLAYQLRQQPPQVDDGSDPGVRVNHAAPSWAGQS